MRKYVWLIAVLTYSVHLHSAEAAPAAAAAAQPQRPPVPNSVFLLASRKGGNKTFDSFRWEGNKLVHPLEDRVRVSDNNTDLSGTQYGSYYYAFSPDSFNNRVLVFKLTEDGTIVRDEQGKLFDELPTDETPMSVATVIRNDILYLFVTTLKNSLDVFRFTPQTGWRSVGRFQIEKRPEGDASDLAVPISIPKTSLQAAVYGNMIYVFMINENVPNILVGTFDQNENFELDTPASLALPFTPTALRPVREYKLAVVQQGQQLYLFAIGAIHRFKGFIYGWRMAQGGFFEPILEKKGDIPGSITITDLLDKAYITVSFVSKSRLDTYFLQKSQLHQKPLSTSLTKLPEAIQSVVYEDKGYVVSLIIPKESHRPIYFAIHRIDQTGFTDLGKFYLIPGKFFIPYKTFVILPYYGQRQQEVVEAIDIETTQQIPIDVFKRISEFVTPISEVPKEAASTQ